MYTETVSNSLWELLSLINDVPDISNCYLGGGTALALQLGHRISEDFDFFVESNVEDILFNIKNSNIFSQIHVSNQTSRHIELMINSIKIDIIKEQISLNFSTKPVMPDFINIMLAAPKDIGRMKILAIGSRGSKKDFIDLYCLTRKIVSIDELINLAMHADHGVSYSKLLFLKGLVDFETADKDVDPLMIWDVGWEKIKETLVGEIMQIADKI